MAPAQLAGDRRRHTGDRDAIGKRNELTCVAAKKLRGKRDNTHLKYMKKKKEKRENTPNGSIIK